MKFAYKLQKSVERVVKILYNRLKKIDKKEMKT